MFQPRPKRNTTHLLVTSPLEQTCYVFQCWTSTFQSVYQQKGKLFMSLPIIRFNKRLSNHTPRIMWRLLWRFSITFLPLHVDSGRGLLTFYVMEILHVVSNLKICCHCTQWDFRSVALRSVHTCFSSHGYWKWKCEKKATRCYCSKSFCSFWRVVFRSKTSNS